MKRLNAFALSVAILTLAPVVPGNVPIIVATPNRMLAAMKLVTDAQGQLKNGDVAGAKRNVDSVLERDPAFWPALYVRAQIYSREGKYNLALKDCNEALRQDRSVVATAISRLGARCAWHTVNGDGPPSGRLRRRLRLGGASALGPITTRGRVGSSIKSAANAAHVATRPEVAFHLVGLVRRLIRQ